MAQAGQSLSSNTLLSALGAGMDMGLCKQGQPQCFHGIWYKNSRDRGQFFWDCESAACARGVASGLLSQHAERTMIRDSWKWRQEKAADVMTEFMLWIQPALSLPLDFQLHEPINSSAPKGFCYF